LSRDSLRWRANTFAHRPTNIRARDNSFPVRVFSDELIRGFSSCLRNEIDAYTPLCAQAEEMEWTHETALLTSILNQKKLASELLAGLAAGQGPLKELVIKSSLKHARAAPPRVRAA